MKTSKSMLYKSMLAPILGVSALLLPVAAIAQTNSSAQVQTARPPILTDGSITSMSQISADDPIMKRDFGTPGRIAFNAAQNLIERYGVVGVAYQDKTIRPGTTMTTGEAAILLDSAFDTFLNRLHPGYVDELVAYNGFTAAMKEAVARELLVQHKRLTLPQGTCIGDAALTALYLDVPTNQNAAQSIYRLRREFGRAGLARDGRRFDPNRTLTWGLAVDCLPKPANRAYVQRSNTLQRTVAPQDPISRGDFLVALNAQMDAVNSAILDLRLDKIPAFAPRLAAKADFDASEAAFPIFRASIMELGKVSVTGQSTGVFVEKAGRVALPNVSIGAGSFSQADRFELSSGAPNNLFHSVRFLNARSLGANMSAIAQAIPNYPLVHYQDIAGQRRPNEQLVFEGRRSLGGQGAGRRHPVVVHHTQRIMSQPNEVPVLTVRMVTAFIETPSGVIIHRVESPPQAPQSTTWLFPALEAIALNIGLGEPVILMQAPVMAVGR